MGKIEEVMIDFLSQSEIIADLFNGYVFNGEAVIQPEMLQVKERKTAFLIEEEQKQNDKPQQRYRTQRDCIRKTKVNHSFEIIKKERDIVREVIIGKQRINLMICGVEEQTKVDYSMPLRVLSYDTLEYLSQARRIARSHKQKKDVKDAEYLSGFSKKDKLIPTLTIVVYAGQELWDTATNLDGMFEDNEYVEKLLPYMVKAPLNVLSIFDVEDTSKYHGDLRKLLDLLRYAGNWKAMDAYLQEHKEEYRDLNSTTARVVELLLDLEGMQEEADSDGKEMVDVCKAIQEMKEIERKAGREEGRQEGLQEGRYEGLQEGEMITYFGLINDDLFTIEEAAKRVNMSIEKFEQAYQKYLEEKTQS